MRDNTRRIEKYKNKVNGLTFKSRTDAYAKQQTKNYAGNVGQQVEIENKVKEYMSKNNLPVLHTNFYILFLKKIINQSLEEAQITYEKWLTRGLSDLNLLEMAWIFARKDLAGIYNGLMGLWKFNEGAGTQAFDSSGKGHTGNFYDPYGYGNPQWVAGKQGYGLNFVGDDDGGAVVNCGVSTDFDTAELTITCWIKESTSTVNYWGGEIIEKTDGSFSWGLYTWDDGTQLGWDRPSFRIGGSWTNLTTKIQRGVWNFLAVRVIGNKARIFINRTFWAEATLVQITNDPTAFILIGGSWWSYAFKGIIDNVRIYNRGLTWEQIQKIYDIDG